MRDLSLQQFRQELVQVNEPTRRYIINFHRGPLFGRGHGHFSPLLGYLEGPDLVLVGDVNPNYRPILVKVSAYGKPWTRSTPPRSENVDCLWWRSIAVRC